MIKIAAVSTQKNLSNFSQKKFAQLFSLSRHSLKAHGVRARVPCGFVHRLAQGYKESFKRVPLFMHPDNRMIRNTV
jgi:hypothetical protein